MVVDIYFQFAKIFDINARFEVVLGQKFTLLTDAQIPIDFFSDKDSVLSLTESATGTDCVASALGTSVILMMDANLTIQKKLTIDVVSAITAPVVNLGLTADAAISKP